MSVQNKTELYIGKTVWTLEILKILISNFKNLDTLKGGVFIINDWKALISQDRYNFSDCTFYVFDYEKQPLKKIEAASLRKFKTINRFVFIDGTAKDKVNVDNYISLNNIVKGNIKSFSLAEFFKRTYMLVSMIKSNTDEKNFKSLPAVIDYEEYDGNRYEVNKKI